MYGLGKSQDWTCVETLVTIITSIPRFAVLKLNTGGPNSYKHCVLQKSYICIISSEHLKPRSKATTNNNLTIINISSCLFANFPLAHIQNG
jgi:hypothetical protein